MVPEVRHALKFLLHGVIGAHGYLVGGIIVPPERTGERECKVWGSPECLDGEFEEADGLVVDLVVQLENGSCGVVVFGL